MKPAVTYFDPLGAAVVLGSYQIAAPRTKDRAQPG
jgi:hypothetical protein